MQTATANQGDRYNNRAPRGGAFSPVNHRFYRGGQWMPKAPEGFVEAPAKLKGSSRQVAWANRLRAQVLAALEDEITVTRMFLVSPGEVRPAAVRARVETLMAKRDRLMVERSASSIIDRRAEMA